MTRIMRRICIGTCAAAMVVATALSTLTPAMARYTNATHIAIRYGTTAPQKAVQTLTEDTAVYDFGCWSADADATTFSHTIEIAQKDLPSGRLRFAWDEATYAAQDVAVALDATPIDGGDGRYIEYAVSPSKGSLNVPFSLTFTDPTVGRLAVLDVSWYPTDSQEPTLSARYLLALVSAATEGEQPPAFVDKKMAFLTDRLLRVAVTTPEEYAGVCLTVTDSAFAAQTRYYTDTYPQGVTLLRDSVLYIDRTAEDAEWLVDLSHQLSDEDERVSLTVGVSDELSTQTAVSIPADAAHLTVTADSAAWLVSDKTPLTVTLTEPTTFRDSDWTTMDGTAVDLTWRVEQRVGDTLKSVKLKNMSITADQTDSGGTLTIDASEGTQPAGTYCLTVVQYYKGYPVYEMPMWFFIDYR